MDGLLAADRWEDHASLSDPECAGAPQELEQLLLAGRGAVHVGYSAF